MYGCGPLECLGFFHPWLLVSCPSVIPLLKPVQPAFSHQFVMRSIVVTRQFLSKNIFCSFPGGFLTRLPALRRTTTPQTQTLHLLQDPFLSLCLSLWPPSVIQFPRAALLSSSHHFPVAISNLSHNLSYQINTLVNSFLCFLVSAFGSTS